MRGTEWNFLDNLRSAIKCAYLSTRFWSLIRCKRQPYQYHYHRQPYYILLSSLLEKANDAFPSPPPNNPLRAVQLRRRLLLLLRGVRYSA